MGKCKFLKQKKQVQINGEWVDTRSYRYILYCDGSIPCVIITNGRPYESVRIRTIKLGRNEPYKIHKISLDYKGYGYLQLESDDSVMYVRGAGKYPYWTKATAEIRGCYVHTFGGGNSEHSGGTQSYPKYLISDVETLIVSCSMYDRQEQDKNYPYGWEFYQNNLIFKGFDTSNVTDMSCMFSNFTNLKSLDLSSFDTRNVTNMGGMFSGCKSLTSIDLSSFDTSNVTSMGHTTIPNDAHYGSGYVGMFSGCKSLTSIDLSSFDTSNVTDMNCMFYGCSGLTSLDLSNFNTSKLTDMGGMFNGCISLTSIDLSNFNTSNVTNMGGTFYGCSGLTSLDLSNLDMSNVTRMSSMFGMCNNLTSLKLSKFKPSDLRYMPNMFYGCSGLTSLDLSGWNTSNVTGQNMSNIFYYCSNLESLDLSGWDMSKITHAGLEDDYMFKECPKLSTIRAVGCNEESIFRLRGQLAYVGMENQVTIITE